METSPNIFLGEVIISHAIKFRYPGHIITHDLKDGDEIDR